MNGKKMLTMGLFLLIGFAWAMMADAWQPEGNVLAPAVIVLLVTVACSNWVRPLKRNYDWFFVGVLAGAIVSLLV